LSSYGGDHWPFKEGIEPGPQGRIRQRVEAAQRRQVRETPRPGRLELQKPQQRHGDQLDPDLHLHRVFTGSNKDFDLELLLQALERQFDLPPLLIDGGNGTRGKMHDVSQECQCPLLRLLPDRYQSKRDGTSVSRMQSGEADYRIGEHGAPVHDLIQHVNLRTRDKPHIGNRPAMMQRMVEVASINGHDYA